MRALLFFLFTACAFASQQPSPTDLATLQGDASAIVCDCVNAITGELLIDQEDHVVVGAVPLILHRRQLKRESIPFFPQARAQITVCGTLMTANVFEKSGIALPYFSRETTDLSNVTCRLSVDSCSKGITHSPGYNLSENLVQYRGNELTLIQSNGAKRIYEKINHINKGPVAFKEDFVLREEILETGQVISYAWDSSILREVKVLNPNRTYAYSSIKRNDQTFTTSDGHLLEHRFEKGLVVGAQLPHHPKEVQERDRSGNLKRRALPEGRECKFKYDDRGRIRKLVFPEKIEYRFDYSRGITTLTRPEGAQMIFHYDPSTLRLQKIEHEGRIETFKWDDWGYLLEKSLEGHSKLSFEYDDKHNLLTMTNNGYSIHYVYDEANRVILEREDNGFIKKTSYVGPTLLPKAISDYRNERFLKKTIYEYDSDFLLSSERIEGNEQSPWIFTTLYERCLSSSFYGMITAVEKLCGEDDCLIGRTEYQYDAHGQVISERVYDSERNLRYTIKRTYDSKGRLQTETDPEGHITQLSYDLNGNRVLERHPNGLAINRKFDACNRLHIEDNGDQTSTYTYWKIQAPKTKKDHLGAVTQYLYDKRGNCISENCEGAEWRYQYNPDNQVVSATDPLGNVVEYTYDANGNITKKAYSDSSFESYTYNLDGTLNSYTQQNGLRVEYEYDDYGNVSNESFFSQNGDKIGECSKSYNAFYLEKEVDLEGNQTLYSYNEAGLLVEKNESGRVTTYRYDSLGRPMEEQVGDHRILRVYDLLNRVTSESHFSWDNLITQSHTKYDRPNRTTSISIDNHTTTTTYDIHDREVRIDRPDGTCITYHYFPYNKQLILETKEPGFLSKTEIFDHENRLIQCEKKDGSNKRIALIEYGYDKAGNLRFQKHPMGDHVIEYQYDQMNRKISEIECNQKRTTFTYALSGEVESITKPDGVILSYVYDSQGFLKFLTSSDQTIQYQFEHDKLGRLIYSKDLLSGSATKRTLNPFGNVLREELANGLTLDSTFDIQGRRIHLSLPTKKELQFTYLGPYPETIRMDRLEHTYTYDPAGNLKKETRIDGSIVEYDYDDCFRRTALASPHFTQFATYTDRGNLETLTTSHKSRSYQYDSLDQLIEDDSHSYEYDPLQNRIRFDGREIFYNDLNQIESPDFEYDLCGNLIRFGILTFKYDALDRLVEVRTLEKAHTYVYDAQHRRIIKDGVPYIWDGNLELGTHSCYRILGRTPQAEIGSAVAIYLKNKPLVPIFDLLGNQTILKDLQGTSIESQTFSSFGDRYGELATHWGYASKHLDPESGLIYFGRRFYSPALGRFITPDPEGYVDSANLYQYCLNNPLVNKDPYGLTLLMGPAFTLMNYEDSYQVGMAPLRVGLGFMHDTGVWIGQFSNYSLNTALYPFQNTYGSYNESMNAVSNRWNNIRSEGHADLDRFMEMAGVDLSHRGYQLACNASEVTLEAAIIASTAGLVYKSARAAITGFEWIQSIQASKVSKSAVSTIEHAREFEVGGSVFSAFQKRLTNEKTTNSLITPEMFFKTKDYETVERIFQTKFGDPMPGAPGGKSFYNSRTKRTFHLHSHPEHQNGKPHVDVRTRGKKGTKVYFLKENGRR